MALKVLNKVKTEGVVVSAPVEHETPQDVADQIDLVASLTPKAVKTLEKIKALTAELKPFKDASKLLASMMTKLADERGIHREAEFTEYGQIAGAKAGKKVMERIVKSQKMARELLGEEIYDQKATIGLGVIDQYLTPEQKAELLEINYNDRGVSIVPKPKSKG